MRYRTLLLTAAFCAPLLASAQSTLNFGIRRRQGAEDLPKTKAPIENVVRKQKENRKALLAPAKDGEYILTQGWELINADSVVSKPFSMRDTIRRTGTTPLFRVRYSPPSSSREFTPTLITASTTCGFRIPSHVQTGGIGFNSTRPQKNRGKTPGCCSTASTTVRTSG